jgi:hypothetical protein
VYAIMESNIIDLVQRINHFSAENIVGPGCIDPEKCLGNCCNTSPDIPKILAQEWVNRGLATVDFFLRTDTLAFRPRINPDTRRCVCFDPEVNGCSLHQHNLKPPQCCLYPIEIADMPQNPYKDKGTFTQPENINCAGHPCRKGYVFTVDASKLAQLEELLAEYFTLTFAESAALKSPSEILEHLQTLLDQTRSSITPNKFIGIKDCLDGYHPLFSVQPAYDLLTLCEELNLGCDYFTCTKICETQAENLKKKLATALQGYLSRHHPKDEYYFKTLF